MRRSAWGLALAAAVVAVAGWWWRESGRVSARPGPPLEVRMPARPGRDGIPQSALSFSWTADGWWLVSTDGASAIRWKGDGGAPEPVDLSRQTGGVRATAVAGGPGGGLYVADAQGRRLLEVSGMSRRALPAPYGADPRARIVVRTIQPAPGGLLAWLEVASAGAIGSELWLLPNAGPARKLADRVSGVATGQDGVAWVTRPSGGVTRLGTVDGSRSFDLPLPAGGLVCLWRDVACVTTPAGDLALFRVRGADAREVLRLPGRGRWAGGPDGRIAVAAAEGDRITIRQWQLVRTRLKG